MKPSPTLYRLALCALVLTMTAAPAAAFDRVIDSGLDVWITRGNGSTFMEFQDDPIPADFFCSGAEPFAGKIVFRGTPVATFPEGALGRTDTILQRLDEAVFDENGVAVTRLQIRALQFVSVEPLKNECGAFQVRVMLDGEQPITEMRIIRESALGGRFEAEVAVTAKLVFTPLSGSGEILEIGREIHFPPRRNSYWAHRPGPGANEFEGFLVVDTDFNGQPDTFLPGTSRNFAAGWPAKPADSDFFRRQLSPQTREDTLGDLRSASISANPSLPQSDSLSNALGALESCGENCHCSAGCGDHCLCASSTTSYCP